MAGFAGPADILVFDGQSLFTTGGSPQTTTAPTLVVAAYTVRPPVSQNGAFPGLSWGNRAILTAPYRVDPYPPKVTGLAYFCELGGTSDIGGGLTAAQIQTSAEAYWDNRRAAGFDKLVSCTAPDDVNFTAPQQVVRAQWNALLKASTHLDAYVDLAAIPAMQNAADTTYFYDGRHPTALGCQVMATAIVPVLQSVGLNP